MQIINIVTRVCHIETNINFGFYFLVLFWGEQRERDRRIGHSASENNTVHRTRHRNTIHEAEYEFLARHKTMHRTVAQDTGFNTYVRLAP